MKILLIKVSVFSINVAIFGYFFILIRNLLKKIKRRREEVYENLRLKISIETGKMENMFFEDKEKKSLINIFDVFDSNFKVFTEKLPEKMFLLKSTAFVLLIVNLLGFYLIFFPNYFSWLEGSMLEYFIYICSTFVYIIFFFSLSKSTVYELYQNQIKKVDDKIDEMTLQLNLKETVLEREKKK